MGTPDGYRNATDHTREHHAPAENGQSYNKDNHQMGRCKNKKLLFLLIYLMINAIFACNPQRELQIDDNAERIDSLIKFQKINEKTIVISFGTDAITAIKTEKGIVIIDAGISTGLTNRYKKRIEAEFNSNNFTYLINTHGHPDHIGGNNVFTAVKIVGQENCLQEISEQNLNPEKHRLDLKRIVDDYDLQLQKTKPHTREWDALYTQKIRYLYAYYDVINNTGINKPDITFPDSLNIDMEDVTFKIIYFGKCHSNSDIYIFVPELKILFIGDLFSPYGRPSISDSMMTDKDRWRQTVQWIEQRMNNIEKIIGGHGQILLINDLKSFNSNIMSKFSIE
jgi:glyoxylase-like metal-dependent hydrolase (beta-lactamase superfamily II)